MAAKSTVHVKNVAASTSDSEIRDFFSFCGKIADFQVTTSGETKSAEVTFEKPTAMKTALLLNNTQLGPNHITVTGDATDSPDEPHHSNTTPRDSDEITQEEKPRARIFAEYLAHGYVIGDAAMERAIDLDSKHGVSNRFVNTLTQLDQKYHARDRARATDTNYGLTQRANTFLTGIGSYFERATNTPTGKKIVKFYTDGSRQVQDIHAEARRLADVKKSEYGGSAYKAAGLEKVFGKEKEKSKAEPYEAAAAATSSGAEKPGSSVPAVGTEPLPGVQEKSMGGSKSTE